MSMQGDRVENNDRKWWVLGIATLATLLSSVTAADFTLALKPLLDEFHRSGISVAIEERANVKGPV